MYTFPASAQIAAVRDMSGVSVELLAKHWLEARMPRRERVGTHTFDRYHAPAAGVGFSEPSSRVEARRGRFGSAPRASKAKSQPFPGEVCT